MNNLATKKILVVYSQGNVQDIISAAILFEACPDVRFLDIQGLSSSRITAGIGAIADNYYDHVFVCTPVGDAAVGVLSYYQQGLLVNKVKSAALTEGIVQTGQLNGVDNLTIGLSEGLISEDDEFNGMFLWPTGADSPRKITDTDSASNTVTIEGVFDTNPASDADFTIYMAGGGALRSYLIPGTSSSYPIFVLNARTDEGYNACGQAWSIVHGWVTETIVELETVYTLSYTPMPYVVYKFAGYKAFLNQGYAGAGSPFQLDSTYDNGSTMTDAQRTTAGFLNGAYVGCVSGAGSQWVAQIVDHAADMTLTLDKFPKTVGTDSYYVVHNDEEEIYRYIYLQNAIVSYMSKLRDGTVKNGQVMKNWRRLLNNEYSMDRLPKTAYPQVDVDYMEDMVMMGRSVYQYVEATTVTELLGSPSSSRSSSASTSVSRSVSSSTSSSRSSSASTSISSSRSTSRSSSVSSSASHSVSSSRSSSASRSLSSSISPSGSVSSSVSESASSSRSGSASSSISISVSSSISSSASTSRSDSVSSSVSTSLSQSPSTSTSSSLSSSASSSLSPSTSLSSSVSASVSPSTSLSSSLSSSVSPSTSVSSSASSSPSTSLSSSVSPSTSLSSSVSPSTSLSSSPSRSVSSSRSASASSSRSSSVSLSPSSSPSPTADPGPVLSASSSLSSSPSASPSH